MVDQITCLNSADNNWIKTKGLHNMPPLLLTLKSPHTQNVKKAQRIKGVIYLFIFILIETSIYLVLSIFTHSILEIWLWLQLPSIYPLSFASLGSLVQWLNLRSSDYPHPNQLGQILWENPFPHQPEDTVQGLHLVPRGGILTRCLNHLDWLLRRKGKAVNTSL